MDIPYPKSYNFTFTFFSLNCFSILSCAQQTLINDYNELKKWNYHFAEGEHGTSFMGCDTDQKLKHR